MSRDRFRLWIGELGQALPTLTRDHRYMFFWKRATATEDEVYIGLVDATDVMRARRLITNVQLNLKADANDSVLTGNTEVDGPFRDNSGGSWTATADANMGSSPGTLTKSGNEYCGRITQTTGASLTNPGDLWAVVFEHARPTVNFVVLLTAENADTAALQLYLSATATTGFTIASVGDPPNGSSLRVSWFIVDRV